MNPAFRLHGILLAQFTPQGGAHLYGWNNRQQGKEAIGKEQVIVHCSLFIKVPSVQVCDASKAS